MTNISVQFTNVSKRYRLGMTRTSLPSLMSDWVKSVAQPNRREKGTSTFHWAVRDVSFQLDRGDSLALVGSNGAGKTTILKLLAQITKPTKGDIQVNGKLSALIELGAGFHPDLSGRENIFLNGTILGLKNNEIRRRLDSIVSFAELERFIDTPVKRYSSGMTVRLGFAIAASIDPDILLVDEVLAVGDTNFRLKCMARIQELIDQGTTLIFVSHNMGLVKAVCDKGIFIESGQARFFGNTDEVIEVYNRSLNEKRMAKLQETQSNENPNSGIVEIVKIDVSDPDGKKENVLHTNRPGRFSIQYHAYQEIGDVSIVLRIIRSDGVFCCAIYSQVDRASLSIGQGTGMISIDLQPLQLYPGTYYGVVTLKNMAESLTFDKVYSDWFEVRGDGSGYEDLDAVFEPNRKWDHQRNIPDAISPDLHHAKRVNDWD